MIEYIKLSNFKSFKDITFDLRGKNGKPKPMAFIYGENGSGKSNLISSIYFLSETFDTLSNQEKILNFKRHDILSSLEIEDEKFKEKLLDQIIKKEFSNLESIIHTNKTINSEEHMKVEIGFYINDHHGSYYAEFNDDTIVFEELKYIISERTGVYFKINHNKKHLSPSIFHDTVYKDELLDLLEKYWGKHSFMSIIYYEMKSKNTQYISKRIDSHFITLIDSLRKISVLCKYNNSQKGKISIPFHFLGALKKGTITSKEKKELYAFEDALNTFFTSLYADVKKVFYNFKEENNGKMSYELFFSKMMNGELLNIPFSLESTGTQKLLDIFPFIFSSVAGADVFIDEIDSDIHDLLICEIIDYLSDSINGQFIATTHNTLLMKKLKKEYIYILQSDVYGNKKIVPINEYEFRTQNNHNTQNKYLDGSYNGVPFASYIDFNELVDDVEEALSSRDK